MNKEPNVLAKLDAMSLDELLQYDRAAKTTNFIVNTFGVLLSFILLIYMTPLAILMCGVILYVLGSLGAGISDTRYLLKERILKLDK